MTSMADEVSACVMGWRKVLEGMLDDAYAEVTITTDEAAAQLLAMPPADRIALARELLEGTGMLIGPWVPAPEHMRALDANRLGRIDALRAYRYLLSQADPNGLRDVLQREEG